MPATVSEFREGDYDAVVGVRRDAGLTLKPSDTLPELRKVVERNPGLFLVAEEDGAVRGAVIGAWDGRRAWIDHPPPGGEPGRAPARAGLAVLPDQQGRGLGRMLMDGLERRLAAVGATRLNLLVERNNAGVADFYRALGYAPDDLLFLTRRL